MRARQALRPLLPSATGTVRSILIAVIQLAEKYEFIYATIGIHPHEAKMADGERLRRMAELARRPKVIAWGEIGLDYFYDHSSAGRTAGSVCAADGTRSVGQIANRDSLSSVGEQRRCLGRLLGVDSDRVVVEWIGRRSALFHRDATQARRALDMGFMVSFAGNVTFPKAQQIRDAALDVPLDRMLIETDSPFLAPVPYRGKRNEPAYVREVARQMGELRGISTEDIGAQTTENFYRFFSLHEKRKSV